MFQVEFAEDAVAELEEIRPYDRARLLDEIEEQLSRTPSQETRNRKPLLSLVPEFQAVPPVWELRSGDYRVFYDVDEAAGKVYVRAVRLKPPHRTTKEIT